MLSLSAATSFKTNRPNQTTVPADHDKDDDSDDDDGDDDYCVTLLQHIVIIIVNHSNINHIIISYHISLTDLVPPALCPSQGPVMRRRAAVVLASGVCVCLCLTCVCTCEPLMSSYVLLCVWLCVGLCLLWCLLARCLALACATIYDMSYVCHPHLHVRGNVISLKSIRKPLVWDQAKISCISWISLFSIVHSSGISGMLTTSAHQTLRAAEARCRTRW